MMRAIDGRMVFGLFENVFISCGRPVLFMYETGEAVFEFAKININKEQGHKGTEAYLHTAGCSLRY